MESMEKLFRVRDMLENFVEQALEQPELDVQTFIDELLYSACWIYVDR
jgi:hypothetical protein